MKFTKHILWLLLTLSLAGRAAGLSQGVALSQFAQGLNSVWTFTPGGGLQLGSPTGVTFTPGGGLQLGSPTGGDKGTGALNIQYLYIQGVEFPSSLFTILANNNTWTGVNLFTGGIDVSGFTSVTPQTSSEELAYASNTAFLASHGSSSANIGAVQLEGNSSDNSVSKSVLASTVSGGSTTNVTVGNTSEYPTITLDGSTTVNYPAPGNGLTVAGASNTDIGLYVKSGSSGANYAFIVQNSAASQNEFLVFGDGSITVGAATGGPQGLGSINAQAMYVNGVAVATTSTSVAQTTGTITLTYTSGCNTGTATGSGTYSKIGNLVSVRIGTSTGCTTATTGANIVYAGWPAAIWPTASVQVTASMNSGGALGVPAVCTVGTGGALTCEDNAAISSVNVVGLNAGAAFSYPLN